MAGEIFNSLRVAVFILFLIRVPIYLRTTYADIMTALVSDAVCLGDSIVSMNLCHFLGCGLGIQIPLIGVAKNKGEI